ncbi:MAG: DNA polymerase III subunit epsilon [Pseudomonadota bacterium]
MSEQGLVRQLVLDTETTGLETKEGHRLIEIGCVELINRRMTGNDYHQYIKPDREIDAGAIAVHGITNEFLADKPRFAEIAEDFVKYIDGAELVIHNAAFDVGFLNYELGMLPGKRVKIEKHCDVLDTLMIARKRHPGQPNNLDALCKRYSVDNSNRELHGALLDAQILADVYLMMTGGQVKLMLDDGDDPGRLVEGGGIRRVSADRPKLRVIQPTATELEAHQSKLDVLDKEAGEQCLWRQLEEQSA